MGYVISNFKNKEKEYSFYETRNRNTIVKVISDSDIKDFMFPVKVEELYGIKISEVFNKNLTVYAIRVGIKLAGLAFFTKNGDSSTVDQAVLPEFRGKDALELGKKVILDYVLKNKVYELNGKIRKSNKRAIYFCKWLKFFIYNQDKDYFYVRRYFNG